MKKKDFKEGFQEFAKQLKEDLPFIGIIIVAFAILITTSNVSFLQKIANQVDMVKADIEVYKSLRKDGSAPKELVDLTKPILEFDSKDGKFHQPILVPERIDLFVDKNDKLYSKYGSWVFAYEINPDGSGWVGTQVHIVPFYKTN